MPNEITVKHGTSQSLTWIQRTLHRPTVNELSFLTIISDFVIIFSIIVMAVNIS